MKRMTIWEKVLECLGIIFILASIVYKSFAGARDTGILVMLSFAAVLLYVILLICAFFPADWRMTEKQKAKIKDMSIYQMKYRKIFVVINFVLTIGSSALLLLVG